MGNSLSQRWRGQKNLVLCELSALDPSSPAERGEMGEEQQLQFQLLLLLQHCIHWLVKIALLLASVPGLASGFPEQGSSCSSPLPSLPPSRQGLLEDTRLRRPLPCPGHPLGKAFVLGAPCKPSPASSSSIHEGKPKIISCSPRGCLGASWAFRGKVNARLSVQIVFCSPLAQVWLSRCLETAFLRSRLVQCRDFFF